MIYAFGPSLRTLCLVLDLEKYFLFFPTSFIVYILHLSPLFVLRKILNYMSVSFFSFFSFFLSLFFPPFLLPLLYFFFIFFLPYGYPIGVTSFAEKAITLLLVCLYNDIKNHFGMFMLVFSCVLYFIPLIYGVYPPILQL